VFTARGIDLTDFAGGAAQRTVPALPGGRVARFMSVSGLRVMFAQLRVASGGDDIVRIEPPVGGVTDDVWSDRVVVVDDGGPARRRESETEV
jgi:hypothetical protein